MPQPLTPFNYTLNFSYPLLRIKVKEISLYVRDDRKLFKEIFNVFKIIIINLYKVKFTKIVIKIYFPM